MLFIPCALSGQDASVFMGHYAGFQVGLEDGQLTNESFNSSAFLALHNKSNIVIGGVASLNALLRVPFNEVGGVVGYSDSKWLGLASITSYQSNFNVSGVGVRITGGYTFEFQKNIGIGPGLSIGSLWADGAQQMSFSIGLLVKQLKQ